MRVGYDRLLLLQAPGFHDYVSSDAELWQAPLQRAMPHPPTQPLPPPSAFDSPQPSPRWPDALVMAMSSMFRPQAAFSSDGQAATRLG